MHKKLLALMLIAALQPSWAQPTEKDIKNRQDIQSQLLDAKVLLEKDNGRLWGKPIWNDSIIAIDFDSSIYSLIKLPGSQTDNDTLHYKTMDSKSLAFVNTTQKYQGKEYATVMRNYLDDKSATVIHELFHLLQMKSRKLNGDSIGYLDQTDARILLRLEYQALKNALKAIIEKRKTDEVKNCLKDAAIFRKIRQKHHAEYLSAELELETLEGLANYTGLVLSSYENKYEKAIEEINSRENAKTYTRPFPYATGPAYGLIFDYLDIPWRNGLDKTYDFGAICQSMIFSSDLTASRKELESAKKRNGFGEINRQEMAREKEQNRLIAYYTSLLVSKPVLKVAVADLEHYGRTFNMNGTLALKDKGMVYSSIKGRDRSGKNFGNFATAEGKSQLGRAGILSFEKNGQAYFVFPLPCKIEEKKIIGEFYEIQLNPGWKAIMQKDGNMEIIREQ